MNELHPKGLLLHFLGLVCCIVPVLCATASYFPLWIERGAGTTISGFTLFIVILAFMPLLKFVRRILRSPASYTMWLIAFIIFALLSSIAEEMKVICFVGFVSNIVGALFFKSAKKFKGGGSHNE